MDILDDMGVSKLSACVFFFSKVNYSFCIVYVAFGVSGSFFNLFLWPQSMAWETPLAQSWPNRLNDPSA